MSNDVLPVTRHVSFNKNSLEQPCYSDTLFMKIQKYKQGSSRNNRSRSNTSRTLRYITPIFSLNFQKTLNQNDSSSSSGSSTFTRRRSRGTHVTVNFEDLSFRKLSILLKFINFLSKTSVNLNDLKNSRCFFYQKVVVSERKLLNSAQNWLFLAKNALFRPKLLNIKNRIQVSTENEFLLMSLVM